MSDTFVIDLHALVDVVIETAGEVLKDGNHKPDAAAFFIGVKVGRKLRAGRIGVVEDPS